MLSLKTKDETAREEIQSLKEVLQKLLDKEGLIVVRGSQRFYLRKKRTFRKHRKVEMSENIGQLKEDSESVR